MRTFINCSPSFIILIHISLNIIINLVSKTIAAEHGTINLNIPDVRPTHMANRAYTDEQDESYLCSSKRLDLSDHQYVVGFQPNASATKVHHILIYGCSRPGIFLRDTPNYVWECGEMNLILDGSENHQVNPYDQGSVCASGGKSTILFGWALDAPAIEMPPEVGFKIGGQTGINYLVLQVHYGHTQIFRDNPDLTDNSGIILNTVSGPDHGITKMAGIYLLLTYGYVVEGISKHRMECLMSEDKVLHPFRFRTHTHKLGTKVGAYKKPKENPTEQILIGEHDPQEPQMFYPVEDKQLTISKGDRVYAYCDYNNTRGKTIMIGATGNDEMCNFYMMYWTEGNELLKEQDCIQYNP